MENGPYMKQVRERLKITVATMAEAAGVSPRQINRYESGDQDPTLDVASRIARRLGLTIDELAGYAPPSVRSVRLEIDGLAYDARPAGTPEPSSSTPGAAPAPRPGLPDAADLDAAAAVRERGDERDPGAGTRRRRGTRSGP
jgi:transcriptional regulator with XRE-family HTH domain